MKKSKRMQPVLRVAETKEQRAAIELGKAQNNLQTQMHRLSELQNYQSEYLSRFQQSGQNGMDINTMQSFRSFLAKLAAAVEQQLQTVKIARDVVEKRKQQWFATRGRVKIYTNVITRFVNDENKQEEKREQKETDERAQRSS